MHREINYLGAKLDPNLPPEGNLSVFLKNCSTAEMPSVLSKQILFTNGVQGPFISSMDACCGPRAAVETTSSIS